MRTESPFCADRQIMLLSRIKQIPRMRKTASREAQGFRVSFSACLFGMLGPGSMNMLKGYRLCLTRL